MWVRLLGPVAVTVDGSLRPVRGLRRKAVLAVLALRHREIVSTDTLVDVVWGDAPPPTAANTLQSHVSQLRQVLGDRSAIVGRPPGYLLDLGADGTDVEAVQHLLRQGAQAMDAADQARHFEEALALWRGQALADLAGLTWLDGQAARLDRLRLQATLALVEARLALGEHAQLVPDLERLTTEHPFDEQIHRQLILALYRSGRQADALTVYHALRRALNQDLGIDPSPALRDLEAAVLRQDPALDPPPPAVTLARATAVTAPTQLPLALPALVGRARELDRLDAVLPGQGRSVPAGLATAVIAAVSGTAGVGKTALAVHWAHRVAGQFPDGQLYVNLRGFDPSASALDPGAAIRGFLDAFGVSAQRIPADLDGQVGLYRTVLAGRRVLVVLDNARDVEQVRPLLPGTAGCMAIVTSRSQLTGLVAAEGAHHLTLDVLTAGAARDLIVHRLGADRVATGADAVDDIVDRCARLPLALAIVAARAAIRPDFPLGVLAAGLRAATGALDALDGGDPAIDVRAVFSWSYRGLSTAAARLFRLLGLHSGPDLSAAAAASLAGVPLRQVREPLTELTRAHLLTEHAPGRYAFHDLLRAYAAEQARTVDNPGTRSGAIRRMLDHYLHTAYPAARLLYPPAVLFPLGEPAPGVTPEEPTDFEQATAWFTAERPVLLAAVSLAAGTGYDAHVGPLAWTLDTYLKHRGLWPDNVTVQGAALAATRRLDDRPGQARAHRALGAACTGLGRYEDARAHLEHALALLAELDDPAGQGLAQLNICSAYFGQGRFVETVSHSRQALAFFRTAGDRVGEAQALNASGWAHANLGDYERALDDCQQALTLLRADGDLPVQASTVDSIGFIQHCLGAHRQAAELYQQAVDLWRNTGNRFCEAETLTGLGDAYQAAGDPTAANRAWQGALDILAEFGNPDAEKVRAKLTGTPAA
jgi:DNA-binding SARP family transcriptional activator